MTEQTPPAGFLTAARGDDLTIDVKNVAKNIKKIKKR